MKGNETLAQLIAGKTVVTSDLTARVKMENGHAYVSKNGGEWIAATIPFDTLLSLDMVEDTREYIFSFKEALHHLMASERIACELCPCAVFSLRDDGMIIRGKSLVDVSEKDVTFTPEMMRARWAILDIAYAPTPIPEAQEEDTEPAPEEASEETPEAQEEDAEPVPSLREFPELMPSAPITYPTRDVHKGPVKDNFADRSKKNQVITILTRGVQPMAISEIASEVYPNYDSLSKDHKNSLHHNLRQLLSTLINEGQVERIGKGRNTRYSAPGSL